MGNRISLTERISLIKNHPLFCLLTEKDIELLAAALDEISISTNEVIVKEEDILDDIYFIAEGCAEVTRRFAAGKNKFKKHIAHLEKGDIIGLTSTGFFSTSGLRTATVIAISPMILLTLNLACFYQFLSNYPSLKDTCEKFILIKLIKKTDLFANLTHDKLRQLTKGVSKITVAANNKLFSQNDPADKCYFILSGEISIVTSRLDGTEFNQATLTPGAFFGEAALYPNTVRNASAFTKTDSTLLQLDRVSIQKTLQFNSIFLNAFRKKRLKQIIPVPVKDIQVYEIKQTEGNVVKVLENSLTHKKLHLSKEQWQLWQQLDGVKSLSYVLDQYRGPSDEALAFIINLQKIKFIVLPQEFSEPESFFGKNKGID